MSETSSRPRPAPGRFRRALTTSTRATPARRTPTPVRRLAAVLYGYSFLADLILLYPVYALLFADTGLSVAQISSLFALWSLTGIVLEVPSGVLADVVSRRLLLIIGPVCAGAGYGLWILVPSYWSFAVGFALWGVRGALTSGALEALVYEELERVGAADRYASIMGRARAVGLIAVLAAMALAGPVFAAGGYPAVGAASVLACLLGALAGVAFPEHRPGRVPDPDGSGDSGKPARDPDRSGDGDPDRDRDDDGPAAGYLATVRAGLALIRTDHAVRRALLLIPGVTAVWGALEEYVPLLAGQTGVAARSVPLLVLLVTVGATVGGLFSGSGARLGGRGLAALVGTAALALAIGAGSRHPTGFVLVALAFGVFQLATVVADARLQERISGTARATVTSLAGVVTELVTLGVFAGYAVLAGPLGHGLTFAFFAASYLASTLVMAQEEENLHR